MPREPDELRDAEEPTTDGEERRRWEPPRIDDLPPLTELTLSTGAPIPGEGDPGGGSTVF